MKRPQKMDAPMWDWREAIIHLSAPELNELIRNAQSILMEKQDELREEMLARFRREAHSLGLSFDDLVSKVAPSKGKPKPVSEAEKMTELPANAEARIIRALKFANGQGGQKLLTAQVFRRLAQTKLMDQKAIGWVKRQRRMALATLLNDMTERKIITVLRQSSGVGTQTIYGLVSMQADSDEDETEPDEAGLIEEAAD